MGGDQRDCIGGLQPWRWVFLQASTFGTAVQCAQHAHFHVGTLASKSYATRPEAAPLPPNYVAGLDQVKWVIRRHLLSQDQHRQLIVPTFSLHTGTTDTPSTCSLNVYVIVPQPPPLENSLTCSFVVFRL